MAKKSNYMQMINLCGWIVALTLAIIALVNNKKDKYSSPASPCSCVTSCESQEGWCIGADPDNDVNLNFNYNGKVQFQVQSGDPAKNNEVGYAKVPSDAGLVVGYVSTPGRGIFSSTYSPNTAPNQTSNNPADMTFNGDIDLNGDMQYVKLQLHGTGNYLGGAGGPLPGGVFQGDGSGADYEWILSGVSPK